MADVSTAGENVTATQTAETDPTNSTAVCHMSRDLFSAATKSYNRTANGRWVKWVKILDR